jgi:hypothetical protein
MFQVKRLHQRPPPSHVNAHKPRKSIPHPPHHTRYTRTFVLRVDVPRIIGLAADIGERDRQQCQDRLVLRNSTTAVLGKSNHILLQFTRYLFCILFRGCSRLICRTSLHPQLRRPRVGVYRVVEVLGAEASEFVNTYIFLPVC